MTTPTVIHVMPVNPFAYTRVALTWVDAVPAVPNAYRKVASIWNRIIPIDKNIVIAGQLFPRST